jgi:hypothetical protein
MKSSVAIEEWDYIPKELDVGTIVHRGENGYAIMEFLDKKGFTKGMVEVKILRMNNTVTGNFYDKSRK